MQALNDTIFSFDSLSLIGIAAFSIAILFLGISGEVHQQRKTKTIFTALLFSLLFFILLISAKDLLIILLTGVGLGLSNGLLLPYYLRNRSSAELIMKYSIFTLLWFLLMVASIIFAYTDTHSLTLSALNTTHPFSQISLFCLFVALGLWLGVAPFYAYTVDCTDNKFMHLSIAFIARTLSSSILFYRCINAIDLNEAPLFISNILIVFIMVSLLVTAIRSGDQVNVLRAGIYLMLSLPLLAAAFLLLNKDNSENLKIFALLGCLCAFAIPATVGILAYWRAENESLSWEEFGGCGRKYPLLGACFIFVTGTIAGLPGSMGFILRLHLMQRAFAQGKLLIVAVVGLSLIIGATTVIKFAIFLFAKPANYQMLRWHHSPQPRGMIAAVMMLAIMNIYYYTAFLSNIF